MYAIWRIILSVRGSSSAVVEVDTGAGTADDRHLLRSPVTAVGQTATGGREGDLQPVRSSYTELHRVTLGYTGLHNQ